MLNLLIYLLSSHIAFIKSLLKKINILHIHLNFKKKEKGPKFKLFYGSQLMRFQCVKFLAQKSGNVIFLTNFMSAVFYPEKKLCFAKSWTKRILPFVQPWTKGSYLFFQCFPAMLIESL